MRRLTQTVRNENSSPPVGNAIDDLHALPYARFVMSYGGKGGGVSLEDGGGGHAERDTEKKYEMLYEADLDPFKEFDSRESVSCPEHVHRSWLHCAFLTPRCCWCSGLKPCQERTPHSGVCRAWRMHDFLRHVGLNLARRCLHLGAVVRIRHTADPCR